jgi:hypothetical protein
MNTSDGYARIFFLDKQEIFDGSAHRRTTLDARSLLHRRRTSTASHQALRGCPLRSEKRRGAKKTDSTMLHGLQGLLLYSAHRRTKLDARSLLHRQRTSTASHQALGGGTRGAGCDNTIVGTLQTATRLRRHHLLHSTGRRSAAGSSWLQGCCARGARRPRLHFPLHSAGRRPAAGSCRLLGCGARRARRHATNYVGCQSLEQWSKYCFLMAALFEHKDAWKNNIISGYPNPSRNLLNIKYSCTFPTTYIEGSVFLLAFAERIVECKFIGGSFTIDM